MTGTSNTAASAKRHQYSDADRAAVELDRVRSKPMVDLTREELDLIEANDPIEYRWVIGFLSRPAA